MPEFILGCTGPSARTLGISPSRKLGFTVNLLVGSFIPQRAHQNLCHHIIFISIIILWTKGTEILLLQQPYWLTQHQIRTEKKSCLFLWLANNPICLMIPSAWMRSHSCGYVKKLGFKSHQAVLQGWGNTYHKSIIWKAMSSLKVLHEVSTPVIWISPWHWGTNWANLQEKPKKGN